MENLNLADAFAKFGGKAASRLYSVSAMAADGSMILGCSAARFAHPSRGVLRYEDKLSREPEASAELKALGTHLELARDGKLPVRMIVIAEKADATGKVKRDIHVRADLVGNVVQFDGDHFIVDFVRVGEPVVLTAKQSLRR
jgi:hypothetical protein